MVQEKFCDFKPFGVFDTNGKLIIPFDVIFKVSLPHVTTTFGNSYPLPAPATLVRSGNTPLSAPQVTAAAELFEAVVVVVGVIRVIVFLDDFAG